MPKLNGINWVKQMTFWEQNFVSDFLCISMIYLIMPCLQTTPSYTDLSQPLMIVIYYKVMLIFLLTGVNYTKCTHLSLGLNSPPRQYTIDYSMGMHQIGITDEENDLWITFNQGFKI